MCDSMAEIVVQGNTPTGVGKTDIPSEGLLVSLKHPHGRGEDLTACAPSIRPTCRPLIKAAAMHNSWPMLPASPIGNMSL